MSHKTETALTEDQIWAFVLQVTLETIHEMARRVDGGDSATEWQSLWDTMAHQIANNAVHGYQQERQTIKSMFASANAISGYAITEMTRRCWSEDGLEEVANSAFANWLYDHSEELGIARDPAHVSASDLAEAWIDEMTLSEADAPDIVGE